MKTNEPLVEISPARPENAAAIQALAREIWHAHYPGIITVAQIEYMLAQRYDPAVIRGELERNEAYWDLLRADGELVAFASYFPAEQVHVAKLDKLYVHPAHQRKGYGAQLVRHVCEAMRKAGCDSLMLAVNKRNARAIAAYRKHGFSMAESVTKDIGGGFVMDDYIMVKDLKE